MLPADADVCHRAAEVVPGIPLPSAEKMERDADDVEGKLLQLKRLLDAGALSGEEFAAKKAELLERI